ncbi:TIR domain-containing protein, partial [Phocaeicola vulgatus]
MAEKKHNIFISHYGEDERQLDSLKQRLRDHGCDIRNSSVEKKKYRPYKVTDATIARYLRICIRWAKTFIVMIGEHTHKRPWVNYEIRNAARQGKGKHSASCVFFSPLF